MIYDRDIMLDLGVGPVVFLEAQGVSIEVA